MECLYYNIARSGTVVVVNGRLSIPQPSFEAMNVGDLLKSQLYFSSYEYKLIHFLHFSSLVLEMTTITFVDDYIFI